MKNATFLALQGRDGTTADLAPLIDTATACDGRLSVLHIGPVPLLPGYAAGAAPYALAGVPNDWIKERNALSKTLAEKQAETRAVLKDHNLTGEVATLCVEPAGLHGLVAARAVFADVCVVQNSLRKPKAGFDNIVYGLLFESPAPVVLNVEQDANALRPERVMIAWNNSLPAARAVRSALPLLRQAKEVSIACFDPNMSKWVDGESPGADLATWLSHHGCKVTVHEYATGGKTLSVALMERATEQGANLVVMGAYGRSRLNERIFGGTTLSMIRQPGLPVFLVH